MENGTQERSFGDGNPVMPILSEQMVRRDNFFHSCWMDLKVRRPDLWQVMTEVELNIAGLEAKNPSQEKSNEPEQELDIL